MFLVDHIKQLEMNDDLSASSVPVILLPNMTMNLVISGVGRHTPYMSLLS